MTKDEYCAYPVGDEAVLVFTVLGTKDISSVSDGIIESLTKGTMITTESKFLRTHFVLLINNHNYNWGNDHLSVIKS